MIAQRYGKIVNISWPSGLRGHKYRTADSADCARDPTRADPSEICSIRNFHGEEIRSFDNSSGGNYRMRKTRAQTSAAPHRR